MNFMFSECFSLCLYGSIRNWRHGTTRRSRIRLAAPGRNPEKPPGFRNDPRTGFMARNLLELRSERAESKGGSRDDHDPTQASTQTKIQTVGDHLGGPGRLVGEDPPRPLEVLAQEADRAANRELAGRPQRDPLPDAHRLPVGTTPPQVRPQEHRP